MSPASRRRRTSDTAAVSGREPAATAAPAATGEHANAEPAANTQTPKRDTAERAADMATDTLAHEDMSGALRSRCPVACSLDLVGDRWTLLVIRDLFAGKARFGEFLDAPEHIPTNILAERLKRLQAAGLVAAVPYSDRPPRHAYALTARGRALGPVLDALADWGLAQFPGTRRRPRLARA